MRSRHRSRFHWHTNVPKMAAGVHMRSVDLQATRMLVLTALQLV